MSSTMPVESSINNSSNNSNKPSACIDIKNHSNLEGKHLGTRQRSNDSGFGDDESPTDNYQQWKKLATIAKELHGKHAGSISKMLVEVKKQIPGTPARRARRHALSSFDQLNKAERERLGKINPLHKSSFETKDSCELVKEYVYTALVSKCRPRSMTIHDTPSTRRHSFPPDKRARAWTASNSTDIHRKQLGKEKPT